MDSSIDKKRKAELLTANLTTLKDKNISLPKMTGNLQTIPNMLRNKPVSVKPEDEVKEEKGIFDKMVEELPQEEEEKEDVKKKKHPSYDKTKTYLKRKQKAKRANQARKKQRRKK